MVLALVVSSVSMMLNYIIKLNYLGVGEDLPQLLTKAKILKKDLI